MLLRATPEIHFSTMLSVIRATATLRCASRALSMMPARTAMTLEQAMMSGHLIVSELKTPTMVSALQSVRQGDKLSKWQQANAVLIQCTLRALPQIGMTQDARGLHMYTESFAEISRSELAEERDALQGLNAQKVCANQLICHRRPASSRSLPRSGTYCSRRPSSASLRHRWTSPKPVPSPLTW